VSQAVSGGEERLVTMMDGCDPESFNAADVTCVRSGGVTFERFLELLRKHQTVGAWQFSPGTLNARVGRTLLAVNQGGEVHTFTEVEEFGGGVVLDLKCVVRQPRPGAGMPASVPGRLRRPGGQSH
jgi:hypothetical protein